MTADCATLWIGDTLGPVERACFRSVLAQGHSLALYCYTRPSGIPDGVEICDAAAILPHSRVVRHHRGSVAPFADWFRLELQGRALGTWVDCDMYLLRPLDLAHSYLFGEEEPGLINNAVLRMPSDCALLRMLLQIFETRRVPDWLPWRFYLPARLRELARGSVDLSRLPFGVTGPFALTAAAARLGLTSEAVPPETFNPVRWQEAAWIRSPGVDMQSVITDKTVGIHLWNECIQGFKNDPAPRGSFLERLQREGA